MIELPPIPSNDAEMVAAERVARRAAENLQIAYFAPGERPQ